MNAWTPTTEVIRDAVTFPRERLGEPRPIKPEAFDRWLDKIRREAKAEAWEECCDETMEQGTVQVPDNPYLQEQDA